MRFVDHEQIDRCLLQHIEKLALRETLGRGEDELGLPLRDFLQRLGLFFFGEGAVERGRVQAMLFQLIGLILHERDERRDDDGGPAQLQCR